MTALLPDPKEVLSQLKINPRTVRAVQPCWQRSRYQAIVNWIVRYRDKPNSPNLEKVRGYIEALKLLCGLRQWESAHRLLQISLTTRCTLSEQLQVWGYAQERVDLHSPIVDKLSERANSFHLDSLASAFLALGQYVKATDCAK